MFPKAQPTGIDHIADLKLDDDLAALLRYAELTGNRKLADEILSGNPGSDQATAE